MKKYCLTLCTSFFLGAGLVFTVQMFLQDGVIVTKAAGVNVPKRILVHFMHMRGFGSGAGYNAQAKEEQIGAGSQRRPVQGRHEGRTGALRQAVHPVHAMTRIEEVR